MHFVLHPEGKVDIVYKRCFVDPADPEKFKTLNMAYNDPASGIEIRLKLHDGNSNIPLPVMKSLPVDHARALWKYTTRLVVQSPEDTGWIRIEDTGWIHTTEYENH